MEIYLVLQEELSCKGMSTIQIVLLHNSKTILQVSCGSKMDHR